MATDFLGQNLNIGDDVIFLNYNRTSANLERGKITKTFPHAAEIGMKRRAEYKIVKILADVAPVVHGYWDDSGRYTFPGGSTAVRCSKCGCALTVSEYHLQNWYYCPVCGAKMDGGDGNA